MQMFLQSDNSEVIRWYRSINMLDGLFRDINTASKDLLANIPIIVDSESAFESLYADYPQAVLNLTWNLHNLSKCYTLAQQEKYTHISGCRTTAQFITAAKAGALYVSLDIKAVKQWMQVADDICRVLENYPELETQLIINYIDNKYELEQAAKIACDIVLIKDNFIDNLMLS